MSHRTNKTIEKTQPNSLLGQIQDLLHQLFMRESALLVAIVIIAGGVWAFIAIADEVLEGGTHAVDEQIVLSLRDPNDLNDPIGAQWVEEAMRDFTAMGGVSVLAFLTIGVVGYLLLIRKSRAALFVASIVISGAIVSLLLKQGFDRPRPDLVPHNSYVTTASFPSGHSMLSATVYLSLGALLARFQKGRYAKIYLLSMMVVLTILVGISRVYLGVHWPTDVLAGWSAGAVWAAFCWLLAYWLQQRGEIEDEEEEPA